MNKEQKSIELLRKLRNLNNNSNATNLLYIPPAQAMRNAADEIERKDALLREIDEFLSTT